MAITIKRDLLTSKRNRPALESAPEYNLRSLKGIVAHWTANTGKGADAKRNRDYFNTTDRFASAHYIVDDHQILQCVPDGELAFHVGAKTYKPDGDRIRTGSLSPNYFLIGFEMCVNSDGDWKKTYLNAVVLAAHLLVKYRLKTGDLYRHFDITGKDCPKMMLDEKPWADFKKDISKKMAELSAGEKPIASGSVTEAGLNVRTGAGTHFSVKNRLELGAKIPIFEKKNGWLRIGTGFWVFGNYVDILFENKEMAVAEKTGANVRIRPDGDGLLIDELAVGAPVTVIAKSGNWAQIGADRWVHFSLLGPVLPPPPPPKPTATVIGTESLNVRKGPASSFPIVKKLAIGTKVDWLETSDKWARIGPGEWAFSAFLKRN